MKIYKKILGILLCGALLVGMVLPVGAAGTKSGDCGTNCSYIIDGRGVLTISRKYALGSSVTIKENAFYGNTEIKRLIINDNVTAVEQGAFGFCTSLEEIYISSTVSSISKNAFKGCGNVKTISVSGGNDVYDSRNNCNAIMQTATNTLVFGCKNTVIPEDTRTIASYAFYQTAGLTEITIPENVVNVYVDSFFDCRNITKITVSPLNDFYDSRESCNCIIATSTNTLIKGCNSSVIPSDVTRIGMNAFRGCERLSSVTLGDNVTFIGENAFWGCKGLSQVTIPQSVRVINSYCFKKCSGLENIVLQKGLEKICSGAFEGCTGLASLSIPAGVTEIEDYGFINCISLSQITVDENNTVYNSAKGCNAIIHTQTNTLKLGCKNTVIPKTVTSVEMYAFYRCIGLESLTIPDSVTKIGTGAFAYCRNLKQINIPSSVKNLEGYTFYNCPSLNTVTIGTGLVSIGSLEFACCPSLDEITLPEGVTEMGNSAFSDCITLGSVDLPSTLEKVGSNAFYNTAIKTATIRSKTLKLTDTAVCYAYGGDAYSRLAAISGEYYRLKCLINEDGEFLTGGLESRYKALVTEYEAVTDSNSLQKIKDATIVGYKQSGAKQYASANGIRLIWCPLTGHTDMRKKDYQPTCTESGYIGGSACVDCDTVLEVPVKIAPLGHNPVTDAAVPATCTTVGYTEGTHCSRCSVVLLGREEIPATGHRDENDDGICDICSSEMDSMSFIQKMKKFFSGIIDKLLQLFKRLFG